MRLGNVRDGKSDAASWHIAEGNAVVETIAIVRAGRNIELALIGRIVEGIAILP